MGEVTLSSGFGQALSDAASQCDIIIEIGSGFGEGSTACLASRLKHGGKLFAVEAAKERAEACRLAYIRNPQVHVFHGVISSGALMTREEVTSHPLFGSIEGHYNQCYDKEQDSYATAPNVRSKLPQKTDMIVLDGGEFSTWGDWQVLKDTMPRIVALDDVNVVKTSAIAAELQKKGWTRIFHTDERNGSSIFESIIG